jgi:hypothetical protein
MQADLLKLSAHLSRTLDHILSAGQYIKLYLSESSAAPNLLENSELAMLNTVISALLGPSYVLMRNESAVTLLSSTNETSNPSYRPSILKILYTFIHVVK